MIQIFNGCQPAGSCPILDDMHRVRKRVFVDILKWNVPVIAGQYERDEFDTRDATYLVSADADGVHLGSFRLLRTDRPHLLGDRFAFLCDGAVPAGPDILEITRGCLSPDLRAAERLRLRNRLISAAIDYGLAHGITAFTCVADSGWLGQILAMGWDCRLLGTPQMIDGVATGAVQIQLDADTPRILAETGTYNPSGLTIVDKAEALAA
ncbi:autoinducer synthase [Sphingomonas sp. MG17]|uniref:Acyl-homoserine-lactone synthase n=1 Tax=Sphingomonas tagetis TaxID=2949092 RepID=A0A9X2HJM9_9SPHN|nr:acyl-homoserine-lactone synthase [Sphingomonas tagetis]MCP3731312.1 autoinducer synthase [Sphingomonas tagetis]